ncbi:hypothetical protein GE061_015661 [Apolygus lucorum]|uniref:Uncharacterized protein n=1 Tax=Apolygus lucorum TaxID=248454 RepID=A0A6A4J1N8_APOLU|nr:hypothetical protein GE061_015661 [Apolygus lucorum]
MEFPEAGEHCSVSDCNSLDFLPVKCTHCSSVFCKNHFSPVSHSCSQVPDNRVTEKKAAESFQCSQEGCKDGSPLELRCEVCTRHFCPAHRHHGCTDAPRLSKSAQAAAVRKEFRKIKEETDKQVQERLRKAKNRALANKIKLMKMKGSAFGDNHIPTVDRIFLAIAPPLLGKEKSSARCIFFSKDWSLGKVLDSAAKRLKVDNKNDRPDEPQLTFFTLDGRLVSPVMDPTLSSLIASGHLVDGDSIILEYISPHKNEDESDTYLDPQSLSKYSFTI